MSIKKHKIIIAVTGASGSIYAKQLIEKLGQLEDQIDDCALLFSDNAKMVWKHELGNEDYKKFPFNIYDKQDFFAPFASGSSDYSNMIICPCSMGTLGRIAGGVSDDLLSRAADVMLKERRKLILVSREMPLNLIHINNMKTLTEAGAIICPASPSFYHKPTSIEQLTATVVDRALQLAGFSFDCERWGC